METCFSPVNIYISLYLLYLVYSNTEKEWWHETCEVLSSSIWPWRVLPQSLPYSLLGTLLQLRHHCQPYRTAMLYNNLSKPSDMTEYKLDLAPFENHLMHGLVCMTSKASNHSLACRKPEVMFSCASFWPLFADLPVLRLGCWDWFWIGSDELLWLIQVLMIQKVWMQVLENTEVGLGTAGNLHRQFRCSWRYWDL